MSSHTNVEEKLEAMSKHDVPMGSKENGNESEQVQGQVTPTPKKVQEATQVMRKLIDDQGHDSTILVSKCRNVLTLIT